MGRMMAVSTSIAGHRQRHERAIFPFAIKAVTDAITGGAGRGQISAEPIGIYRSGPKIEALFLDCRIDMRIGSSSRVPATTQFLRDLAGQWDGDDHMKRVILRV